MGKYGKRKRPKRTIKSKGKGKKSSIKKVAHKLKNAIADIQTVSIQQGTQPSNWDYRTGQQTISTTRRLQVVPLSFIQPYDPKNTYLPRVDAINATYNTWRIARALHDLGVVTPFSSTVQPGDLVGGVLFNQALTNMKYLKKPLPIDRNKQSFATNYGYDYLITIISARWAYTIWNNTVKESVKSQKPQLLNMPAYQWAFPLAYTETTSITADNDEAFRNLGKVATGTQWSDLKETAANEKLILVNRHLISLAYLQKQDQFTSDYSPDPPETFTPYQQQGLNTTYDQNHTQKGGDKTIKFRYLRVCIEIEQQFIRGLLQPTFTGPQYNSSDRPTSSLDLEQQRTGCQCMGIQNYQYPYIRIILFKSRQGIIYKENKKDGGDDYGEQQFKVSLNQSDQPPTNYPPTKAFSQEVLSLNEAASWYSPQWFQDGPFPIRPQEGCNVNAINVMYDYTRAIAPSDLQGQNQTVDNPSVDTSAPKFVRICKTFKLFQVKTENVASGLRTNNTETLPQMAIGFQRDGFNDLNRAGNTNIGIAPNAPIQFKIRNVSQLSYIAE